MIIDSSICVAVMTDLAAASAARITSFCTSGTCWMGSSSPRSPRAIMTASDASRMPTDFGASSFNLVTIDVAALAAQDLSRCSTSAAGARTRSNRAVIDAECDALQVALCGQRSR
jgi:hypothetical protein